MGKSSKYTNRITSLENELSAVRHELALLQSSRSHRFAKFSRQLLSSSPTEAPKTLSQLPDLFKKYSVPAPEKSNGKVELFNPLTNPLPLYKFPNINVGLVTEVNSLAKLAFSQTCNATSLNSTHANELIAYNALQLVIVEPVAYKKNDAYVDLVNRAVESGSTLVIATTKETDIPAELLSIDHRKILLSTSSNSSLPPFADIYNLTQKVVPKDTDTSAQGINIITRPDEVSSINHDTLSVITRDLIDSIEESNNYDVACNLITLIASYCPVIIEGTAPKWLPSELLCIDDAQNELPPKIKEFNKPYHMERYSIKCGREAILQHNPLKAVSLILKDIGLIDSLPTEPTVSIILSTRRPQYLKQIIQQLEKQTLTPHEVIIMLHGVPNEDRDNCQQSIKDSRLNIQYEYISQDVLFGEILNKAVDKSTGEFITKVDDDDHYLPNHLLDLYAAHLSSRADFVGKWNHWVYIQDDKETISWSPENANMYVRHIPGGTLFGKTSIFREIKFGKVRRAIDSELYRRAEKRGAVLFSTHKYNYVRVRHDDHTYTASNADFKSRSDGSKIVGLPVDDLLSI